MAAVAVKNVFAAVVKSLWFIGNLTYAGDVLEKCSQEPLIDPYYIKMSPLDRKPLKRSQTTDVVH